MVPRRPLSGKFSMKPAYRTSLQKAIPAVLGILALVVLLRILPMQGYLKAVLDWISHIGPWGPVVFIMTYVLTTVLFVPASLLTLGSGALFGVFRWYSRCNPNETATRSKLSQARTRNDNRDAKGKR